MGDVARLFAVTVDCPEPLVLARFYQAFAGGEVISAGDDYAVLSGGAVRIDFQRVGNPAPWWPDSEAPRKVHLDFRVEEMARMEARVLELGATLAREQPGGWRFRVFLDPAGHPFCLADAAATGVSAEH
jgi:hypothetical protein